jgi:hypothetical protein
MAILLAESLAEGAILLAQAGVIEFLVDDHPHFGEGERFEDVVAGSGFHGLNGGFNRTERGHDHDGQCGILLLDGLQELEAIHAGELEVGKDEMNGFGGEQFQSSFSVAGGKRFEAVVAQVQFEQAAHLGFVFDDEDGGHGALVVGR